MASFLGLRTESDKLRNLDFLRLVASVGIVFLHSQEFWFAPGSRAAAIHRVNDLQLFVDLFFVISGFVMGFVYDGRIRSPLDYGGFLWRRVARLYPLHLVVLALNIAFWAILLTRGSSDSTPSFAPGCILNNALLVQEYFDCGSKRSFNGVTWSISVEMGMYVILPLLMFIAARGTRWLAGLCCLSILLAIFLIPPGHEWLDTPHLARGLAGFPLGYLLFKGQRFIPQLPRPDVLVLILAAIAFVEMITATPQPVVLVTLVALVTTAIAADRQGRVHRFVDKASPLGQLTYSMYIWHRLVILALMNVVADKMFAGNTAVLVGMTVLTYASIFLVSYAGYFLIEVRARRALVALLRRAHATFVTRKPVRAGRTEPQAGSEGDNTEQDGQAGSAETLFWRKT